MADLATLKIVVDANGAIRAVDQFGKTAETAAKRSDKLATAAKAASVALAAAAAYGIHKVIQETKAAQAAQAQLEAAIRSTGGAAGQSVAKLTAHAAALQKVTAYGDDAVIAMQSVLLTFTKIGGDTFPKATEAVLDLSARLGMDLNSAALQVGKALNDPILGVTALARAGIQFSTEQKAMITALVETNRLAEAQGIILKELNVQFGGSAKAARDTLGGALSALGNAWGDLFEVSRKSSDGIIAFIEGITTRLPGARDKLAGFITDTRVVLLEFEKWIDQRNKRAFEQDVRSSTQWAKFFGAIAKVPGTEMADRLEKFFTERAGKSAQMVAAYADNVTELDKALEKLLKGTLTDATKAADDNAGAVNAAGLAAAAAAERYERLAEAAKAAGRSLTRQSLMPGTPTVTGMQFGARTSYVPGQGVTSLPLSFMSGRDRRTPRDLTEEEKANAEIAKNFRENLQRATGDIFADFLNTGKLSVRDLFSTFRNIGSQIVGQTLSGALMSKVGSLGFGGSLVAGTALSILGGVVDSFFNAGERARQLAEAFRLAKQSIADFAARATETPEEAAARNLLRERDQLARQAAAGLGFKFSGGFDDIVREAQRVAAGGGLGSLGGVSDKARELLEVLAELQRGFEANSDAAREAAETVMRQAAAQRAESLSRTASGLAGFGRDLRMSGLSIYNPFQQSQDAEAEYNRLVALARGGDQDAASQLPAAARAFLESSRNINASGTRYTADFQRVERETAELAGRFEGQAETQRRIADGTYQVHGDILVTNDILTRTDSWVQAGVTVQQTGFATLIEEVRQLRATTVEVLTVQRQTLELAAA